MLKSTAFGIGGLAPYLLVGGIWAYFAVLNPMPFWQLGGDYSWYALSDLANVTSPQSRYRR